MEEQKNNQEQLEEIQETPVPADEICEETPVVETVAEDNCTETPVAETATEETPAETTAEPARKATPGKIALAVGTVVVLAAVLILALYKAFTRKSAPVFDEEDDES